MTATAERASRGGRSLAVAQRLGRSLMLPIATLPAAGLLSRLGQPDLLGSFDNDFMQKVAAICTAAGGGLFNFLPLLFAVGVAVGFARKGDGSTGVAAAVGFVVFTQVVQVFAPVELDPATVEKKKYLLDLGVGPNSWPYGVLSGILVGIVTALLWQRFYRIKLPPYLAFFGGRRFVPIVTALVMIVLGIVFGLLFPLFDKGITAIGDALTSSVVLGAGAYGVLNRLLIPVGLHQIINSLVWTVFGTYTPNEPGAAPVHGDLTRFFAGDPHAGVFMTGFFPIFMFALPAAGLAIWRTAHPSQRKLVGGLMGSAALTSFLTGVTEPLEFAFMFIAWPLYVLHALLTGISLAVVNALGIHLGFSFSAGAIDFVLNASAPAASKAWLLIPIGLIYAVIYYLLFRWVIVKWNLRTLGRDDDDNAVPEADASATGPGTPPGSDNGGGSRVEVNA